MGSATPHDYFKMLAEVPIIWGLAGTIIGALITGAASIFVQRRFGQALTKGSENLVKITENQVRALEDTLKMQKEHYESEAAETKRKYEKDIEEAKGRAKDFEQRLHDRRNDWNNEKLKMTEELAQLRERPDLGTIKSLVDSLIVQSGGIATTISVIGESLKSHVITDADVFSKILANLDKTADIQEKILEAIHQHDEKVDKALGITKGKKKRV